MKHLEPQPQRAENQMAPKVQPKKRNSKIKLAAIFLGLTLGAGSLMTALWGTPSGDDLSESDKAALVSAFSNTHSLQLIPVAAHEIDTALDLMQLDPKQRSALQSTLNAQTGTTPQQSRLGWIELWDFASQDGDIVRISSAGYELDYPLLNAPARLAVPIDGTSTIKIVGVTDGGGGITLGLRSGATAISLPVIQPGQSLIVPVTF